GSGSVGRGGRAGSSDAGEGPVDVGGGEDAVDAPIGLDEEVLGGGAAAERVEEVLAGEVGGEGEPVVDAAGQFARGDPGAAVLGGGGGGLLADEAEGAAVVVGDDDGAGRAVGGGADGLGGR